MYELTHPSGLQCIEPEECLSLSVEGKLSGLLLADLARQARVGPVSSKWACRRHFFGWKRPRLAMLANCKLQCKLDGSSFRDVFNSADSALRQSRARSEIGFYIGQGRWRLISAWEVAFQRRPPPVFEFPETLETQRRLATI
ncbi:hypothetical protein PI124_g10579 [Phytophthora idaei]|nr:hypothetical protein PI125_g8831 [Phytophthora idaei]KAG3157583.1 hypothetical protein PI126_g8258 [Phytophthora idaei]KAG3244645.1 hypothetical protein PI124_g10579 [Phytophthora idaei]